MPVIQAFGRGARDLVVMVRTVRRHRDAAVYLLSRMFFVDGMMAILIYAGVYAAGVMKWDALEMLFFGIILSVLAVLGGFVGRWLDGAFGPKTALQIEIGMSLLGIIACSAWGRTASSISGRGTRRRTRRCGTAPSSAPCRTGSSC